jgi:hypothetical protein
LIAEQMEAAHKTSLAKGEVGIREKKPAPTIAEFVEADFLPHVQSRFAEKATTLALLSGSGQPSCQLPGIGQYAS